jgi:hypothetical protein
MGQVYLGEHVRMRRKSAIKIMRPALVHEPEALQRFTREAENASQLSHSNIASIFDFGETADGVVYLAMEYVDGGSLADLLAREALSALGTLLCSREGLAALASYGARRYPNTKKVYGTNGNSFVAVVEFGPRVRARAVTAGGESGDPASKHFDDQIERYAKGDLRNVYFYPDELTGHTERTYKPGK